MRGQNEKLMNAAKYGKTDELRAALCDGADIEIKDDAGWTPLMWASGLGKSNCCKILVDAGADLEAKDNTGHRTYFCR